MDVYACTHACVWKSEDNLQELFLSTVRVPATGYSCHQSGLVAGAFTHKVILLFSVMIYVLKQSTGE